MKAFFGLFGTFLGVLVFVMLLGTGMGWWGLWFQRVAAPFSEETRRITYGQSMTYQQGAQRDFENLCLQYKQAQDGGSKALIKDMIRRRVQDYVGPTLDNNVVVCLSQLGI